MTNAVKFDNNINALLVIDPTTSIRTTISFPKVPLTSADAQRLERVTAEGWRQCSRF
jgi:hypothetical protein